MPRLLKVVVLIFIVVFVYSVATGLWKSMEFDSDFTGRVQSATGVGIEDMRARILDLAMEHEIQLIEGGLVITPVGRGYEVRVSYEIPLGLGGFAYIWEKTVEARTLSGRVTGIPGGVDEVPSSRAFELHSLRQRPSKVRSRLKGTEPKRSGG